MMAIFKNTPSIVTNGLVYYLDGSNRFALQQNSNVTTVTRGFNSISNGTLSIVDEIIPDGSNNLCYRMTTGTFTNNAIIANSSYNCIGRSTFSVFVKPIEYFYVMLRDGDTTNAQVWFDLINGTIVGGNNTSNGTITPLPNGWFLLTMTISSISGSFSYGTRIGLYPDNTFTGYNSPTPSVSLLYYNARMMTSNNNIIPNLIPNNISTISTNVPLLNNNFNFTAANNSTRVDISPNIVDTIITQCSIEVGFSIPQTINAGSLSQALISSDYNSTNFTALTFIGGRLCYLYTLNNTNIIDVRTTRQSWSSGSYFVQLILNNGSIQLYVNGQLEPTTITTNVLPTYGYLFKTPESVSVGASYSGNSFIRLLSGNISFVKVYNRALLQQEITQNYNALKSRFNLS